MDGATSGTSERRSIPLSALEHFAYCPRQAALIHVESYFASNLETVRGDLAHGAVDRGGAVYDRRRKVWRSLPVWSVELGIHGICDTVQFDAQGPIPVEHKSGQYHAGGPADLQVAGQVICLRSMFHRPVNHGIVFAGRDRRRHTVHVDAALEQQLIDAVAAIRTMIQDGSVPSPILGPRCRRCSLRDGCNPELPSHSRALLLEPRSVGDWHD